MCLDKQCSAVPGPSVCKCQLPEPANMLLAQKKRGRPAIPWASSSHQGPISCFARRNTQVRGAAHERYSREQTLLGSREQGPCCAVYFLSGKKATVVVFSKIPSGSAEEREPGHLFSFLYKVPHGHDTLQQSLLLLSFSVTKARPPTPFCRQLTMTSSFQMATFQPPIVRMMSL